MQLAMLLSRDFSLRLLVTLGHFLWEGALIALVTFLVLQMLRSASARTRCNVLMAAMLGMGAAPMVTFIVLSPGSARTAIETTQLQPIGTSAADAHVEMAASPPLPLVAPVVFNSSQLATPTASPIEWSHRLSQPLAIVYLVIVLVMLGRILLGLAVNQRLWRRGQVVEPQILSALARQMAVLGMRLKPAIAYCAQISTPMVIGVLRPTILLPLSLTSSLSVQQIDSILAHELAHIRRLDPVFILVQRVIEALLFFHPLLWVISRWLDMERERACDQLVVRAGHDHLDYASALIRMGEAAVNERRLPMQLAAAGKESQLRRRILSLLGQTPRPTVRLTPRSCLMLLGVIVVSYLLLGHLRAQAQPTTNPTTAPALLSKEQLLQRVTELRSRVKDISVVTEDVVTKGPPNTVRRFHRAIVLKRDMMYIDELYGNDAPTFHVQRSYDGRQTTVDGRPSGDAMISKGRSREMDTQAMGFFTVNLLNAPGYGTNRSLLGSLHKVPCTIRKDCEIIDGHPCEVVEFADPLNDKLIAWLDLERGLLPLRHRQFRHDGMLWFECNVEKAIEIEKGLWFATRAKTTTFPVFRDLPELGTGIEQVIIVDSGPKGPLIQVNTDPDDSIFDLAGHLPFGTKLFNIDDMKDWRVVGFARDQQPATRPTAPAVGPATPLTVAPAIAPYRKVEFDLTSWGEAAGGVRARFRLPREGGAARLMIDVQNGGSLDLKLDVGRPRVELDGKWYARENERESLSFLPPGRNHQAMGPVSLDTPWIAEESHQPLVKTAGRHAIRVKYMAQSVDGKTKPIEVVTAPLIIEFDAHGIATTQPAQ